MHKIVFSVSCYNNESEIIEFAIQIRKLIHYESSCLVVTCNSCDNLIKLEEYISNIGIDYRIYEPVDNLGYLHGGLFGLTKYVEEGNAYEWAIICNTDIDFLDNELIDHIVSLGKNSSLWGIAPNIIRNSNGNKQNPFLKNRISKNKVHLYKIIYGRLWTYALFICLVNIKRHLYKREVPDIDSGNIYAMDGSFFILRKPLIDLLLNTEDEIFMYGEEIYIAELAYLSHKTIYYCDDINLVHKENGTTSLIGIEKKQKWFNQSFNYLWETYFCDD